MSVLFLRNVTRFCRQTPGIDLRSALTLGGVNWQGENPAIIKKWEQALRGGKIDARLTKEFVAAFEIGKTEPSDSALAFGYRPFDGPPTNAKLKALLSQRDPGRQFSPTVALRETDIIDDGSQIKLIEGFKRQDIGEVIAFYNRCLAEFPLLYKAKIKGRKNYLVQINRTTVAGAHLSFRLRPLGRQIALTLEYNGGVIIERKLPNSSRL